jgi:hypothetical protein
MRRQLPLAIILFSGLVIIITFFIPHKLAADVSQTVQKWYMGVTAFFVFLGILNIIQINGDKIYRRTTGWGYSIVLLSCLGMMLAAGFIGGIDGKVFNYLFNNVQVPLESTMFSLLAFFVASASFRAFRAKTKEATLLLVAAILVMIGRVSIGYSIWHRFPDLTEWIMKIPNTAAKRGIAFGVDLGLISMALRLLLGIERSYMGGK